MFLLEVAQVISSRSFVHASTAEVGTEIILSDICRYDIFSTSTKSILEARKQE